MRRRTCSRNEGGGHTVKKRCEVSLGLRKRILVAALVLSLALNAAASYQWVRMNRATDKEIEHVIIATKQRLRSEEQTLSQYVSTLVELEHVLGRIAATGYRQGSCAAQLNQAARASEELVEKRFDGLRPPYWVVEEPPPGG